LQVALTGGKNNVPSGWVGIKKMKGKVSIAEGRQKNKKPGKGKFAGCWCLCPKNGAMEKDRGKETGNGVSRITSRKKCGKEKATTGPPERNARPQKRIETRRRSDLVSIRGDPNKPEDKKESRAMLLSHVGITWGGGPLNRTGGKYILLCKSCGHKEQ